MVSRLQVAQLWFAALVTVGIISAAPLVAQDGPSIRSPVLTLDQDRLFAQSDFGRRLEADLQADGLILEAENRQIEAALEAEEKDLTERRPTMDPADFRALADQFDERVQRIRSEQAAKARALGERSEMAQRTFLETARPVLEQFMLDSGAVVIIDPRSVVMSRAAIDVTEEVTRRVNAIIGDGSGPRDAGDPQPALDDMPQDPPEDSAPQAQD